MAPATIASSSSSKGRLWLSSGCDGPGMGVGVGSWSKKPMAPVGGGGGGGGGDLAGVRRRGTGWRWIRGGGLHAT